MRVRIADEQRGNLERIASLELLAGDRRSWVPLRALGRMELVPELSDLPRRNGQRINTVQGFLRAGLLPSQIVAEFKERVANFPLPPGYRTEWGGESAERDEAVGNLMASVGLVGVAINDSIVVLAALRGSKAASRGDVNATRDVVVRSTRHVLATTLTTIAGFIPLLLDRGLFWPPLAVAIAGGVGGATLLALCFVPASWTLMRRGRGEEPAALHPTPTPQPVLVA